MSVLIILIYFIFFCIGFRVYELPKKVGMSFSLLSFLFGLKVLFGIINLYFHNSEYISNDAHYYYVGAMEQLSDFSNRPSYYLNDWFFNWGDIGSHLNFLNKDNAVYWSDVGRLLHTRFMVLCTILSFGHEYVNVIFYNLFFFLGFLALYKTFLYFKPNQKWVFLTIIFFIPSIAFWCSGIHKDGFILSLIGFVSWSIIRFITVRNFKTISTLILCLLFLLAIRYFYFLIFLPLFILFLLVREKKKSVIYYSVLTAIGVCAFLFSGKLSPRFDLMRLVVNKQKEFVSSKGYSDLRTPMLEKTPASFMRNLPTAIKHIFIEPIPQLGNKIKYDFAAVDSILVLLLLMLALYKLKRKFFSNAYYIFILFYSVLCLTFIGYTIPNLGALVRYESPFMCLLLLTLFAMGDFKINQKELALK